MTAPARRALLAVVLAGSIAADIAGIALTDPILCVAGALTALAVAVAVLAARRSDRGNP